ncbi:MAG: enoyl-CoA hydratase/isomerase family protein, partial [Dehalococcoidia bacterium]
MEYEALIFEKQNGVGQITLNRPQALNALTSRLLNDIYYALRECDEDPSLRAVMITGAGRGFCAGADISGKSEGVEVPDPDIGMERYSRVIRLLRSIQKPVLGAINGAAAGAGLGIALACDLRIAVENARFGAAFVRVGLASDSAVAYHLLRLVGIGKATELLFSGRLVNADEALSLGLVNRVVPAAGFAQAAGEWAAQLAQGPTKALGFTKQIINSSLTLPLPAVLEFEAYGQYIT